MFFPKLFTWVKNHGKSILTIISIVVAIYGGIQKWQADKWEREALRLDGKLEEQVADQNLLYGEATKAEATRNLEKAEEKKKRENLEARIQKFQKDTVAGKRALREEKAKTATLPPTELVAEINARIGEESTLTGAGLFLFTRLGTTRTLDKFKDGEFYLSEYNKFEDVLTEHKAEVDSFNTSITACEEAVIDNLIGWNDCREALDTAIAGRKADKKVATGKLWRGRKQGAGAVAIIVGVLKIFGIW